MRLLINTATTFKGGSIQVARSFIEGCSQYPEHEFHVVLGERIAALVKTEQYPANFTFYRMPYRPATRVFHWKRADEFLRQTEKEARPEVAFTTSGPSYWRPSVPHLIGYNLPHYVYPDSPFFQQISLFDRLKWQAKGRLIRYFYRKDADAIVAQTSDVAERAAAWLGVEKHFTVANTCAQYYLEPESNADPLLPKREVPVFRLLTLSAFYAHKNLRIINAVAERLEKQQITDVQFVLTLPPADFNTNFTPLAKKYIYNLGPVPPKKGPALYREVDAMFLPTLLECFSASYPEAMAMEKPILTSDLSFARNICADAARYFDPLDAESILKQILKLKNGKQECQELVRAGKERLSHFNSAEERAEKYLKICASLLSGRT